MAEDGKGTTMVLNVDLQSSKCYRKVKKLLCKFPEIRDQAFDEKANKVTIKVVCCSPERIRDKLCCKGGGCIKSIEIKEPKKKPKKEEPKVEEKPEEEKPKEEEKKKEDAKEPKDGPEKLTIELDLQYPLPPPVLVPRRLGFCCDECYSGRPGGPCWSGGRVQYDGCYGRPVYDSWGGGCYTSSYTYYCTEQYQQEGCTIM